MIQPVEYKVLIKPEKVEKKTSGGIHIPDSAQDKAKYGTMRGTLVSVGAIAFTDPAWLDCPEVGDNVLFDRYAGGLVKDDDGEEYLLVNDKEIQAILR